MPSPMSTPRVPVSLKPKRVEYLIKRMGEPRCLLMSIVGRFWLMRQLALYLRSHWRRYRGWVRPEKRSSFVSHLEGKTDRSTLLGQLRRDGVANGLRLSDEHLAELLDFAGKTCVFGDRLTRYRFHPDELKAAEQLAGKPFQQAQYPIEELESLPSVQELKKDPLIRGLVRDYFGHDGVLSASRMFWSYPIDDKEYQYDPLLNSTHYHYDLDDYGCLRVFVYLSDVNAGSGPHRYIRGSHKRKPLWQKLIASHSLRREDDLERHYAKDDVVTVTAPAGTVFIEDASAFHEATRPSHTPRLLMQLTFVSKDFALHAA